MLRLPVPVVLLALLLAASQGTAFWCPMHPNERAASAIPCPVCRMTMVPIPPVRVGEYVMSVELRPRADGRGASGLSLILLLPGGLERVREFDIVHEQPVHVFVIDRTLENFAHVHPDRPTADRFDVELALPPGEFMVVADFTPAGGPPQTLQRVVIAPGANPSAALRVPVLRETPRRVPASGLIVTLEGELTAGKTDTLTFSFTDSETGGPPRDLEPYLGAPAHLVAASADLTDVQHAHPEDPAGPSRQVAFDVTPARAGAYKLWLQLQQGGKVVTVPFVLTAR